MLVAGETLNIFLLTGISNINIFFIKKKNKGLVMANYNVTYTKNLLRTNSIDFHLRG